jgi:cytochrome c553
MALKRTLLSRVIPPHLSMNPILTALILAALLAAPVGVLADDEDDDEVDLLDMEPDRQAGEVMYRQCALCHGKDGQGILGGKYPRIGGLPDYYLISSLLDYKEGVRNHAAMVVVGALQTASDQDIVDLSAYVSDLEPEVDVPGPEEGSARKGKRLYRYDCKSCHGRQGEGKTRKESPPLRGQYHEYLLRQIEMFKNKERIHADDPEDQTFAAYEEEEMLDILAFIASLDDKEEDEE